MNLAEEIDQAVNDGLLEHAKRLVRSVEREQACQALDECRRLAMLTFNNQRTNSNRRSSPLACRSVRPGARGATGSWASSAPSRVARTSH
jgi:hypothetical protein